MKKVCLAVGLLCCSAMVLGIVGCEDLSSASTTTTTLLETTTSLGETTTSAILETTTSLALQTTTTAGAGASANAAATTTTLASSGGALPGPTPKVKLLKGTWTWDVDADVDGGGPNADIWYRIVNELEHYLEPQNGAALAHVSKSFGEVTLSDLQGIKYGSGRLATQDEDDLNALNVGDVIALRTSTGQYAKMEVAGYEQFTASDGITYQRYNIRLRYVLYPK